MIRVSLSLLFLFALEARAAKLEAHQDIDRAVTSLIGRLALPSIKGFDLSQDLALQIRIDGASTRVANRVEGLVRARLEQLGATGLLAHAPDPNEPLSVVCAGAEWLLALRGQVKRGRIIRLQADLVAVDQGLWAPRQKAPIYASASLDRLKEPLSPSIPWTPANTKTSKLPSLRGPPARIAALEGRPVAMAACALLPEHEQLVILFRSTLKIFSLSGGRLEPLGSLELASLKRARLPVREPVGSIVCDGSSLAFSHSDLQLGYVVGVAPRGKKVQLSILETLPGIPLGLDGRGWLVGHTDQGRARYDLALETTKRRTALKAKRPYLELVWAKSTEPLTKTQPQRQTRQGLQTLIGITEDYRVVRLSSSMKETEILGTSGVGISAILRNGRPFVVTTSTQLDEHSDRLTVLTLAKGRRLETDPMEVPGPVRASAIGYLRGKDSLYLAVITGLHAASLYLIELDFGGGR